MKHEYFECNCEDAGHTVRASLFEDDDMNVIYVSMHLESFSLMKRIKNAAKYIFGVKSEYGDFAEYVWSEYEVKRFRDHLNVVLDKWNSRPAKPIEPENKTLKSPF